jgi:dimethylargininase
MGPPPVQRTLIAYTRAVSPTIADCELTHVERQPIDVVAAVAEHEAYEALLGRLGADVRRLPAEPEHADAVFVEDTAVVLDEVAVITRPGAPSRRLETRSVETELAFHRPLVALHSPATLDGGDVLVAGRRVFVGLSSRTNREALRQLRAALRRLDYEVLEVRFTGCLHLKSAVTRIDEDTVLLNPAWVDESVFAADRKVSVDPREPQAANALPVGGRVIHPSHFPRTRARLEAEGFVVAPVALEELAKAEAGVTCCSLLVPIAGTGQRP